MMKKCLSVLLIFVFMLTLSATALATDKSAENKGIKVVEVTDVNGDPLPWNVIVTATPVTFDKQAHDLVDNAATAQALVEELNLSPEQAQELLAVLDDEPVIVYTCDVRRDDGQVLEEEVLVTIECDPNVVAALRITDGNVWQLLGTKRVGVTRITLRVSRLSYVVFVANRRDVKYISPQTGNDSALLPVGIVITAMAVSFGMLLIGRRKQSLR